MKTTIILSLAGSSLAVPFGNAMNEVFGNALEARHNEVPAPEWWWKFHHHKPTATRHPLPLGTATTIARGTGTGTGSYPTASGIMSIQTVVLPEDGGYQTLSVNYGIAPKSTVKPVAPTPFTPVVVHPSISTPPAVPYVPYTPIIVAPSLSTPPAIPTRSALAPEIPYPSNTPAPEDPWSSYASPDITPPAYSPVGPTYAPSPSGTGTGAIYPTGIPSGSYGYATTLATAYHKPQPSPQSETAYGGEDTPFDTKNLGGWKRLKAALGFGGTESEMST